MDKRAYWIWLQHAFGEGSPMPWRIHRSLPGGVEEFCESGPRMWNSLNGIREKDAAALYSFSPEEAQAQLEYALRVGWEVLTPESENYPQALKNIFDPPAVLYGKGRLLDVDRRPAIAVVGARKAKKTSVEKGKEFGYQLAIGGAIVITGGAVGIDAAVAMGAMSGQAPIISVLPVALNSPYVSQNAFLRESIVDKGGVLLSEYFSQQSPGYGTFQARNRLITGLACGVLLIQAARKSGTSMYATHARNQDRDVFVYPGPKDDPAFAGGWDLIADGAKAVRYGEEILEEYDLRFQDRHRVIPLFQEEPDQESEYVPALADSGTSDLTPEQKAVLDALDQEPRSLTALGDITGLPAGKLLSALTELELMGLAKPCPGKRYRRGAESVSGKKKAVSSGAPLTMTGEQAAVLNVLTREPQTVAQLEERAGLSSGKVLGALTELELMGLAQSCPGKRYRRR